MILDLVGVAVILLVCGVPLFVVAFYQTKREDEAIERLIKSGVSPKDATKAIRGVGAWDDAE